jgi:uncharacterized protein YkwD
MAHIAVLFGRLAPAVLVALVLQLPHPGRAADQVNAVRQAQGLAAVQRDERLDYAASLRARDMVARGYFAHRDPADGSLQFEHLLVDVDYRFGWAGEILCRAWDVDQCYPGWMNSPTHREILLASRASRYGIGVAHGADGREYAVALFAR